MSSILNPPLKKMSSILNPPNLQIWDNAAFDNSVVEKPRFHPQPLQPIFVNLDDSLKENRSPNQNPNPKPLAQSKNPVAIDADIADIERQISDLSRKLETLKIKKAQIECKTPALKRGRIVPAKFLNPGTPRSAAASVSASRRGLSLGPMDIYQNATPFKLKGIKEEKEKAKVKVKDLAVRGRRGISIWPWEIRDIYQNATPFKLKGIKKEKEKEKLKGLTATGRRGMSIGPSEILRQKSKAQEAKEKGVSWDRSLSTSPKSRNPMNSKVSELMKGISTVGTQKSVKIDEGLISGIKPKTLFEEKKRPLKNAKVRIVEKVQGLTATRRRGMSIGPSEILRQKSKVQEAKEKVVSWARSLSTSPKSRKPMNSKVSELRKGISTVGTQKSVKIDEGLISGIIPKTLFEEKNRPLKNAKVRIVESRRYSLIEGGNKRRKWSLPDNEKDEKKNAAKSKKRSLSLGGENVRKLMEEKSPLNLSIMRIPEALPKISTLRGEIESPRDSGCAKRVADLVGKRSFFGEDDGLTSPCRYLKFEDIED